MRSVSLTDVLPSCVSLMQNAMVLMEEILKGAHVVVEGDRGSFYSWFVHIQVSTHRPAEMQNLINHVKAAGGARGVGGWG